MKTALLFLLTLTFMVISCEKKQDSNPPAAEFPPADSSDAAVVVDCSDITGKVMNIASANGTSTTSPLPGANAQEWLKDLNQHLVRVWIQLRYVYNKGNVDYNYIYSGTNVGVEDALTYYSKTCDSLLVAVTAYNSSVTWPLPEGAAFTQFIKTTLAYYKTKFPKIKYIEVGNEPDAAGETMSTYYPIYQHYYQAIDGVNDSLDLKSNPILIGNAPLTGNVPKMLNYASGFFKAYAADKDPGKKFDFFSFHSYGEANRPLELKDARHEVDSALQANGLPVIPVLVSEYGIVGGSGLPSNTTLSETIAMQPAGQLTKAFYLYEGGIDYVLNWCVHHQTIPYKSEIADLDAGTLYPYGYALYCANQLSLRGDRLRATSTQINSVGLGVHVLAAMGDGKGIAVLVWNYNWTADMADKQIKVLINNIPSSIFPSAKMHSAVYLIDAEHNNYDFDKSQTSFKASLEGIVGYRPWIKVPLTLERSAVALILLTPES